MRPRCLCKSKSDLQAACSDWVLYRTWALIKDIKKKHNKNCMVRKYFTKVTRFFPKSLPKLVAEIFLFFLFKLELSFNWTLKWTWALIWTRVFLRAFSRKTGCVQCNISSELPVKKYIG